LLAAGQLEKTMDDHEKQIALMEAEMAEAEDAFFLVRLYLDNLDSRNVFRAGFKRAWALMVKWAAEAEAEVPNAEVTSRPPTGND
jgi:hypothetical protein